METKLVKLQCSVTEKRCYWQNGTNVYDIQRLQGQDIVRDSSWARVVEPKTSIKTDKWQK